MIKKHVIRIYDFIRSWLYYPKLCKYFIRTLSDVTFMNFMEQYNSRWKYASWHCKRGKLSDTGYENLHPTFKDISNDWKCVYRDEPITKH